ncbi:Gfo/Idh/MocA family protein [Gynuella sunshinyii]|uniref:Putative dehydrogenase-related protein n=1 Tax=Gynuella sunshinyii YC6258 TaxID=1445510 RepID=A0A0C5VG31_9GAMM|nr:Gfo/Idh/MocA family oxidoreductase [Gynuella sunshinyii]AJQ93151.1 putative dehydrogenase-related protein [Gynuella sunshinyii YC6258]
MHTVSRPLRWGMVGGGEGAFIGEVHRWAACLDGHYQLVAAALSSDPERNRRSGMQLNIDRLYDDYHHMAQQESEREDGIQVVSIVTPNHLHADIAITFLRQGIHVICDKPMTATMEQALELKQVAESSPAAFLLTHNYSAYPLVREARHLIAQGRLGKIRSVQVNYVQDWLTADLERQGNKQAGWRTDKSQAGAGGCLGDIGTHAYQLACFMINAQADTVLADLSCWGEGRILDDEANVLIRFNNGAKGHLWATQVAPGNENNLSIEIYGDQGGLRWQQENPNELELSLFGEPTQRLTRGAGYLSDSAKSVTRTPGGHPEGYLEAFANLYREFSDCLNQQQSDSLLPDIYDGLQGVAFVYAAVNSASRGNVWTSLNEFMQTANT